jgi:hypothetical protein
MSEFPLAILARVPRLVLSLLFSALRFKRKIKKSAKILRKSMVKGGMEKKLAKQLASQYEESLSIRKFMKGALGGAGKFPF